MDKVKFDEKNIIKDELFNQYNWFYNTFLPVLQTSCDDFFSDFFRLNLVSVSKNINLLLQGSEYFVTKVRIDKDHDVFFRLSDDAINLILNKILGENKKFNLSNITELEAKIISAFNDYIYNNLSGFINPPQKSTNKRKNLDTIHLTLFIREKSGDNGGKIIVSLPKDILSPQNIQLTQEKFSIDDFQMSKLEARIKIGTTKFQVKDLKQLEKDDIVIFENSNIHSMKIIYKDYEKNFKITPNPGLIISLDNNNGGHNMEETSLSQSLWDNIQVEMGAEFEKVKITLGELKNIEQGLVVDISSVYDNKISLKVENKVIAKGELVIVNDRYGVRIDEVLASEKTSTQGALHSPQEAQEDLTTHIEAETAESDSETSKKAEEEFDYSDFELDDQDI